MTEWIFFDVLAALTLAAAIMVVRTKDLVHAVLWLALTLLGTAGLYVTMDAGFLAAIQVLLYTGGIVTLMLFAVMLTRATAGAIPAGPHAGVIGAFVAVAAVLGLVGTALSTDVQARGGPPTYLAPKALGALLLGDLALPFEVLSVLLLAAMIGAIVLSRRKEA